MSDGLNERVEAMYSKDRLGAWSFVVVLWLVVPLCTRHGLAGYN